MTGLGHVFSGSFVLPVKKWLEDNGFTDVYAHWNDFEGYLLKVNGCILRWDHPSKNYVLLSKGNPEVLDHYNPNVFKTIKKILECKDVRCPTCNELIPDERLEYGFKTCVKHSDEKEKDHQPGVVNSLGLHEKYFKEGR